MSRRPACGRGFARRGERQGEALRRALAGPDLAQASNLIRQSVAREPGALESIARVAPAVRQTTDGLARRVSDRESDAVLRELRGEAPAGAIV
jgi:hypothetical protein